MVWVAHRLRKEGGRQAVFANIGGSKSAFSGKSQLEPTPTRRSSGYVFMPFHVSGGSTPYGGHKLFSFSDGGFIFSANLCLAVQPSV